MEGVGGGTETVEEPGGWELGTTCQEAGRKQAMKYFSPDWLLSSAVPGHMGLTWPSLASLWEL